MSKKIIISIVVVVLAIISFFIYQRVQAPTMQEQTDVINTQVQSSVGSGIEKTNPFDVDVNPYKGYKNPFE